MREWGKRRWFCTGLALGAILVAGIALGVSGGRSSREAAWQAAAVRYRATCELVQEFQSEPLTYGAIVSAEHADRIATAKVLTNCALIEWRHALNTSHSPSKSRADYRRHMARLTGVLSEAPGERE